MKNQILEAERQKLLGLVTEQDSEIRTLKSELARFKEDLVENIQLTENYQSGCKSAADHIAKLLKTTKDQESIIVSLQDGMHRQKNELESFHYRIEELKESHLRKTTNLSEEIEMYKSSLQKLDELFKKPLPQEETKQRLGHQIQENLELKEEVRTATAKLMEFRAKYEDLERNYTSLKTDFGVQLNKLKLEKNCKLEAEVKCKELLMKINQEEIERSLIVEDLKNTKSELARIMGNFEHEEEKSRTDRRKAAEFARLNDQFKFTIALNEKELEDLKINLATTLEKTTREKSEITEKYEIRMREKNTLIEKCQLDLNSCKSQIESLLNRENTLIIERENLAKKVEFYKLSSAKQAPKHAEADKGLQDKVVLLQQRLSGKCTLISTLSKNLLQLRSEFRQLRGFILDLKDVHTNQQHQFSLSFNQSKEMISSQCREILKQKQFNMRDYMRLKKDLSFMNEFNRETLILGNIQVTQNLNSKEALTNTRKITRGNHAQERSCSKSPGPQNRFIDLTVSNLSDARNDHMSPKPVHLLSTNKKRRIGQLTRNSSEKNKHHVRSSLKKRDNISQSMVYHNDVSLDDTSLLDIQKALAESEKRIIEGNKQSQFTNTLDISQSKNRLNFPSMTQDQFYLSVSPQKLEGKMQNQVIEERTSESEINTSRQSQSNSQDQKLGEDLDFKKIEEESMEIERRIQRLKQKALKTCKRFAEESETHKLQHELDKENQGKWHNTVKSSISEAETELGKDYANQARSTIILSGKQNENYPQEQKNFRFSGSEVVTIPLTPFSSSAQNEDVQPAFQDFSLPEEKFQKAIEFLGMRKGREKPDLRPFDS